MSLCALGHIARPLLRDWPTTRSLHHMGAARVLPGSLLSDQRPLWEGPGFQYHSLYHLSGLYHGYFCSDFQYLVDFTDFYWCRRRELNPRPTHYECVEKLRKPRALTRPAIEQWIHRVCEEACGAS